MCVCLSVCLFSTEIQTDGHIRMKFGTKVVLEGGKVRPDTPHAPDLVGRVTCSDPKSGSGRTWTPCPSGAMVTVNISRYP